VLSVAFSPDGKILASGANDDTVQLWDVATRQQIGLPLSDTGPVNWVAFSPDGKTLAAGGADGTVRLWDVATPLPASSSLVNGHVSIIWVAFSSGGKILAAGDADGTVRLWDVASRKPIGVPFAVDAGQVNSMALSPDGKTLAVGGGSGSVALWDVGDPGRPSRLGPPIADASGYTVAWITFSPDGKTIAIGDGTGSEGEDGDLALWTVRDPAHPVQLGRSLHFGHGRNLLYGNTVVAAAFSPDAKTLAVGTYDGSVTLWKISHPGELAQLGQSFSPVRGVAVASVAFSPDGSTLAVGNGGNNDGGNGTVTLWDIGNPAQATQLGQPIQLDADNPANGTSVDCVAFSPDGSTLAVGTGDGIISLWNVTTPGQTAQLGQPLAIGGENEVNTMLFGAGGRTLTVGGGATVTRWTLPSAILPGATQDNIPPAEAAASNQGNTILAVGTGDGSVTLWNLGDPARPFRAGRPLIADNGDPAESLALSRDGRILAVGTYDGFVTLWNVHKPAQPARLGPAIRVTDGHGDLVSSVALNPAGTTLAVATSDGEVVLYNVSNPPSAGAVPLDLRHQRRHRARHRGVQPGRHDRGPRRRRGREQRDRPRRQGHALEGEQPEPTGQARLTLPRVRGRDDLQPERDDPGRDSGERRISPRWPPR